MWPTIQQPESSAALAWQIITGAFVAAKRDIAALGAQAQASGIARDQLRIYAPRIRVWLQTIADNDSVPGLQAYARTFTGVAAFDLSVELSASRQALKAVLSEIITLHKALASDIQTDGTLVLSRDGATVQECAALVAACATFDLTVQ